MPLLALRPCERVDRDPVAPNHPYWTILPACLLDGTFVTGMLRARHHAANRKGAFE